MCVCVCVEFVKDSLVPADLNVCKLHPWKRVVKTQQLLSLAWDTWCVVRHVISPEAPPPITTPRSLPHFVRSLISDGNRNTVKRLLRWLWSETLTTIRSESSRLCTHVKERGHVWWSHQGFGFMAVLSSIHVNWMKVVITVKRIEAIVLYDTWSSVFRIKLGQK